MADIITLEKIKTELGLPLEITDQDATIESHIAAGVGFVGRHTGQTITAESPAALLQAVVLCVRQFFDGYPEIKQTSAIYALIAPYRMIVGAPPPTTDLFGWGTDRFLWGEDKFTWV